MEFTPAKSKRYIEEEDVVQPGPDGGMSISFVPTSSRLGGRGRDGNNKKKSQKKAGIEYLGAGLERGEERAELPESERKGRSHRRQGVRSGSKNMFRRL